MRLSWSGRARTERPRGESQIFLEIWPRVAAARPVLAARAFGTNPESDAMRVVPGRVSGHDMRMSLLRRMLVTVVAATMLGACGGAEEDGSAARGADQDMLEEYIMASCGRLRACCQAEGLSTAPLDECEAGSAADSPLAASLRDGKIGFSAMYFDQCLTTLNDEATRCAVGSDICARAIQGRLPPGGACTEANECAVSGEQVACLRTNTTTHENPGTCTVLARAAQGEACVIDSRDPSWATSIIADEGASRDLARAYCDSRDHLYCKYPERTCQPMSLEGEPCDDFRSCELGLYCDGTCKPTRAAGDACGGSIPLECPVEAPLCDEGHCRAPTFADALCQSGLTADGASSSAP